MITLKIRLLPENMQIFEELMALYSLKGVEIVNPDDPMYDELRWREEERPLRPHVEPHALLYGNENVLENILHDLSHLIISSEEVVTEEVNWMEKWSEGFEGMEAGNRLFIRPPWIPAQEGKENIVIVPGMAFGTGHHETTRLSAAAIEKWMREGDRVIDVGSGSGVLSLVAASLGASSVLAIENDSTTFTSAKENFSLNPTSDLITLIHGDLLSEVTEQADLIVANILPPVLIELAPQTLSVLPVGGKIILSGILHERVSEVFDAYQANYRLLEVTKMGEWAAMTLERMS